MTTCPQKQSFFFSFFFGLWGILTHTHTNWRIKNIYIPWIKKLGPVFRKGYCSKKLILDSCLTLSKPHYIERLSHFSFTLVNLKRYLYIEQCVLTCIETKINGAWELDWFLNARMSSKCFLSCLCGPHKNQLTERSVQQLLHLMKDVFSASGSYFVDHVFYTTN